MHKMALHNCVRWAFNTKTWIPHEDQLLQVSSFIQPEEKARISRFVFQNDAKASLVGRLMMRKFLTLTTEVPYDKILLDRDERGKPFMVGFSEPYFNVSHQGDFVVLAGDSHFPVGIDVMKIEAPPNKNIPEFFRMMKRQFSNNEWETIRGYPNENEQIAAFYRHWCLKESYVKNIGVGITIALADISFDVKSRYLSVGNVVNDTELYLQGVKREKWVFEESLLDEKHAVAVATEADRDTKFPLVAYSLLTFEELVKGAKSLNAIDEHFAINFLRKEIK